MPHLTAATKDSYAKTIHPQELEARTRGIPYFGSGLIYPINEADIAVQRFKIPDYWPRGYTLDVGWRVTAALWCAYDPDADVRYAYDLYYEGAKEPILHAEAVKGRGAWIPGKVDPAARQRNQKDGTQLMELYGENGYGLRLSVAPNAVQAGITATWTMLTTGKFKVFSDLRPFFAELRVYRRDKNMQIVKEKDHAMDLMRYHALAGVDWYQVQPVPPDPNRIIMPRRGGRGGGWMV